MTIHIRNPIKKHGKNPSAHFAMIPNDLARDTTLSNYAYRMAIEIRSHTEDFEISVAGFAKDHGWGRGRAADALAELVTTRWLALRRYVNDAGNRIFDEYHLHITRQFTDDESSALNTSVTVSTGPDSDHATPLSSEDTGCCPERDQAPALGRDTKEDQQEHQVEDKSENQPSECWLCESTGVYAANPCEMCCPPLVTRVRTAEDRPTSNEEPTCYGCRALGRDSCLIHTSSPVGRLQLSERRS